MLDELAAIIEAQRADWDSDFWSLALYNRFMTLAVALAVPEGIVIGADSRTSYFNSQKWPRVASDYARKVFPLSVQSVAATYGWAFLNGQSIAAVVAEFAALTDLVSAPPNVVPAKLGAHFQEQYEKHISAGIDIPVGAERLLAS